MLIIYHVSSFLWGRRHRKSTPKSRDGTGRVHWSKTELFQTDSATLSATPFLHSSCFCVMILSYTCARTRPFANPIGKVARHAIRRKHSPRKATRRSHRRCHTHVHPEDPDEKRPQVGGPSNADVGLSSVHPGLDPAGALERQALSDRSRARFPDRSSLDSARSLRSTAWTALALTPFRTRAIRQQVL